MRGEELKRLIGTELALVRDARVVDQVRSALIEPYAIMRGWDYGVAGQQYLCWMVLNDSATGAEIAFCDEGFGPRCPWGLVSSGKDRTMGPDSGWYTTFMAAYFESWACTVLPIWRVLRIGSDGVESPLSDEGKWDSTWRAVKRLQQDDPAGRYNCGHSVLYGKPGANSGAV
ncbi:MAG TPA: hypothetical protein VHU23_02515 [Rhizomicrobium sp.]|jgi:hypothetical protein|nr:hypothetical protein [Rhizomicrobium sp.]